MLDSVFGQPALSSSFSPSPPPDSSYRCWRGWQKKSTPDHCDVAPNDGSTALGLGQAPIPALLVLLLDELSLAKSALGAWTRYGRSPPRRP